MMKINTIANRIFIHSGLPVMNLSIGSNVAKNYFSLRESASSISEV